MDRLRDSSSAISFFKVNLERVPGANLTSVSKRLFPQKITEFLGPGLLDILARALQRVRVAGFPLAEPDLELGRRVRDDSGQADVRRLDAVFVDVDIEILKRRN